MMTRDRMSRPSASVPNQCAVDGGESGAPALEASASKGAIHCPIRASSTKAAKSRKAASDSGFSATT